MTTTRETADHGLNEILAKAVEHVKSMTPEERAVMFEAQKKAWVAAEMAIGDEGTRVVTGHRETADHAELLAKLKVNDPTNPAHRLARDLHAGRFASLEARDDMIEVLSEIAALRGALEEAEKDASSWSRCAGEVVTIGESWKERFVQAERQRDEAVGLLIGLQAIFRGNPARHALMSWWSRAKDRIEALANQGADQ